MKNSFLFFACILLAQWSFGQTSEGELRMVSEYSSKNPEMRDLFQFEGIEYMKLQFIGDDLADKSYHLTVKEIWDGKVISDTAVFNSQTIGIEQFQLVNDTVLSLKIIAKHTYDNKLKMTFRFPRFGVTKEYDATDSDDYSLRNVAQESQLDIGYGKKFYLLAYILPYEREDGTRSWCDIGTSGGDIEKWGEQFGIKHYLVFELIFE